MNVNISYRQYIEFKHNFVIQKEIKFKKFKTEKWRIYELELRYGKKRKFDKFVCYNSLSSNSKTMMN